MQQQIASQEITLVLVRHGHVEGIEPARFRGQRELPLTALGRRQAQALSRRVAAEWQPAAIFTSPLGRCLDTAKAIAQPFGLVPEPVQGLIDLDYGTWHGLTDSEVHVQWPQEWARWHAAPQDATFPGGESLRNLGARATVAVDAILRSYRGSTVVIVAHDSINRVLLLHALNLPLSHYRAVVQAPCGLNVLKFTDGQFAVRTVNETGHLLTLPP